MRVVNYTDGTLKYNDKVEIEMKVTGLFKNYCWEAKGIRLAIDGPHPKTWIVVPMEYVRKVLDGKV